MAARTLPVRGATFLGDDPSVVKVLKVTFGDSLQDVTINDGDSTQGLGRTLVNLPWGINVVDVGWRVVEAFDASVNITLGLDGDCIAFADDSAIASTTLNATIRTMRGWQSVINADSRALGIPAPIPTNLAGFTPDSTGNNLKAYGWTADTDFADSGRLEVYLYYHETSDT